MPEIRATARYARAIEAVHELLTRLRLDFLFLGNVARSAWLDSEVATGSLDVLATMGPQQKNQVAMMASNRGFRVEREEVEASEELDIVPMRFDDIRIHVLVASNALYGRMVASGVEARLPMTPEVPSPARGPAIGELVAEALPTNDAGGAGVLMTPEVSSLAPRPMVDELVAEALPTNAAGRAGRTLRIPTAEDFALLLAMMGDEVALHALTSTPEFDRAGYNEKLHSIGLGEHALV